MPTTPSSPFLRLHPHPVSSLPPHPLLASTFTDQTRGTVPQNPAHLLQFAHALLTEALDFTDVYLPRHFKPKSVKSSPPSTAKVQLLSHTRVLRKRSSSHRLKAGSEPADDDGAEEVETWFARRSVHASSPTPGTATFAEFDHGLRHEHSAHELAYTPDVYDAHEVLSWDSELAPTSSTRITSRTNSTSPLLNGNNPTSSTSSSRTPQQQKPLLTDISLRIHEMCHSLPSPLQPRSFAVLIATAKTHSVAPSPTNSNQHEHGEREQEEEEAEDGGAEREQDTQDGFIVAQIPLDIASVPAALYSNARNVTDGTNPDKRRPVVRGNYCSVERCRRRRRRRPRDGAGPAQGNGQSAYGDGGGGGGSISGRGNDRTRTRDRAAERERLKKERSDIEARERYGIRASSPQQQRYGSNGSGTLEGGDDNLIGEVEEDEGEEEVEWIMATASDARGVLPMWVQKLGTPAALVKDVGFFLRWAEGRRGRR